MSVQELEAAVAALPRERLAEFQKWFDEFMADAWDRQIEDDIRNGRLVHLADNADRDFEAGRCTPL